LEQNDIIALVLGLFLPGVGHMMLGQVPKGIAILVASVFTCAGFGLLGIAALVDLYLVARARKYRTLEDWEFFPDYKQAFNL
jgi:TM2 domain-containing membrane protein YozV